MEKRDLKADLELCNKATPGPWVICDWDTDVCGGIITPDTQEVVIEAEDWGMPVKVKREDADFIVQAREGWPHAIERAMLAETLLRDILPMAMWVSCMYKNEPEANPTTHCCIWNEVVKRIQEVLRDETR